MPKLLNSPIVLFPSSTPSSLEEYILIVVLLLEVWIYPPDHVIVLLPTSTHTVDDGLQVYTPALSDPQSRADRSPAKSDAVSVLLASQDTTPQ